MKLLTINTLAVLGLIAFLGSCSCDIQRGKRFTSAKGVDWSTFLNFWRRFMNRTKAEVKQTAGNGVNTQVDCQEVNCFLDPCQMAACPGQADATCRTNNCGSCKAEFYLNDVKLTDEQCSP